MMTNFRKWIDGAWLVGLAFMVGMWVIPAAQAQTKDQMLSLLQGYEWRLEPVRFKTLSENADLVLREIAEDSNLMNSYRFRALSALQVFPKDRVVDFFEESIDRDPASAHARRAFEAFSAGFSESHPQRVLDMAEKLLQNANPHVRISAARSLRQLNSARAKSAYQNYLKGEKEDWILQAIQE